jgi:hypothetical protein
MISEEGVTDIDSTKETQKQRQSLARNQGANR